MAAGAAWAFFVAALFSLWYRPAGVRRAPGPLDPG
jgi:hypothetical protein